MSKFTTLKGATLKSAALIGAVKFMVENPFQFGRELGADELVNRKNELDLIAQTIENSNKLFLIGNRRYGKTSLLKATSTIAEKKGHLIFRYNAEGYPTLDALVKTIVKDAAKKLGGSVEKAGQEIKSFFGSLRPEVSFSVSQTEWKVGLGVAPSAKPEEQVGLLIEVLNGLERLASNQPPEKRVALMIDEFQEIVEAGGRAAEKQIRAAIQEHKRVAYIFSGSKTRLLTDMTTNKSRPFYRLGQNLFVNALPREEFRQFLLRGFGNGGFQVDGATDKERSKTGGCVEQILEFAQDVPYNVQMLAHTCWEMLSAEKKPGYNPRLTDDFINAALERVVSPSRSFVETATSDTFTTRKRRNEMPAKDQKSKAFTDEERAAMKERAKELKAEERANKNRAEGESEVLAKIAEMPESDRVIAERLHEVIKANAPVLSPKTWYGMPAYAKDGKVVCFFQSAQKFSTRYATLGFSETANLDEGDMWPTSFALKKMAATEEARIIALVTKAVS